jgi:hypothetical protein
MKTFASRTGIAVATWAAAMALVWALFVPYRYPWPSVAWAVLAGVVGLWVAKKSALPAPSMNDIIRGVEGEPAPAAAPARRAVSTRVS